MLIIHGWNDSFAPEEPLKENIHFFTDYYNLLLQVCRHWMEKYFLWSKIFSNLKTFQIIRKPK